MKELNPQQLQKLKQHTYSCSNCSLLDPLMQVCSGIFLDSLSYDRHLDSLMNQLLYFLINLNLRKKVTKNFSSLCSPNDDLFQIS